MVTDPPKIGYGSERRRARRFPIHGEVRYRLLDKSQGKQVGVGRVINISSKGVLFTVENKLIDGERVQLSIKWPVKLDSRKQLNLVVTGRVVRQEKGRAAIEIQRREFRVAGSVPARKHAAG